MAKKETKSSKDKTSFFKSFKTELKKVIWPTPKQLLNNTLAVVAIVVIIGAIVFVLDVAFKSINEFGIEKVKEVISTNTSEENSVVENTTQDSNETENVSTESNTNSEENTQLNKETVNE